MDWRCYLHLRWHYWPKKTPRPYSAALILIPEAIDLRTKEYGTALIFSEPESFRFELETSSRVSCSIQLGTFCGEASRIWICSNFEGEHSGFGEVLGFGSKVWRWSGAMPGIPSTLSRILHSSTTSPSSIDFNFFTTLSAFLKNFSHCRC